MFQCISHRRRRIGVLGLALAAFTGLAACSDFLEVTNPGAVEADDLNAPAYVDMMRNGVISQFQLVHSWVAYYGALFTDELHNTHVYFEEGLFDQRRVEPNNGTYSFFIYGRLHQARFLADSFATRMTTVLGDSAGRDLRLAQVRLYGGYSYIMLGENLCETPIDVSAPMPSDSMFDRAVERFDQAITVATAAKSHPGASAAAQARADTVIWSAQVGAARALLNMGEGAAALTYTAAVPDSFALYAHFSENSAAENNMFYGRLSTGSPGSNSAAISYTPFLAYDSDPRVPRPDTRERGMNADSVYIPNSPLSFTTYTGTDVGANFARDADMVVASGLEARYIEAEVEGLTAENLAFLNERRAVGGDTAWVLAEVTEDEYMAELRRQRSLDLYLSNHRMGDLRRYLRLYGVDEFPSGDYPNSTTTYADQTCWPLNLAEINSNPNVPKN